jgi:alkylated DNA repair dioxygenase AlkB
MRKRMAEPELFPGGIKKSPEPAEIPSGFEYEQGFLSEKEEGDLLERFQKLNFTSFNFKGYVAKRRTVEYSFEYDFSTRKASSTKAIQEFLKSLRENAAKWAGVAAHEIVEAVITEYPPGAPIGWHRDVPQFDLIIGVSLASGCRMRLRPYKEKGRIVATTLDPRSVYAMCGVAVGIISTAFRPLKALRYSVKKRKNDCG